MQRRTYRKRGTAESGGSDGALPLPGVALLARAIAQYRATLAELEEADLPPEIKNRRRRALAELFDAEATKLSAGAGGAGVMDGHLIPVVTEGGG